MAKIQEQLTKILSAVYGKDVRNAIHDSIFAINKEVEKATSSEAIRTQDERKRASAEEKRQGAEQMRTSAENTRVHAEESRAVAENARVDAERLRQNAQQDFARSFSSLKYETKEMVQNLMDASKLLPDKTLSKEGFPADAKATGDKIAHIDQLKMQTYELGEDEGFGEESGVSIDSSSVISVFGSLAVIHLEVVIFDIANNVIENELPLCWTPFRLNNSYIGLAVDRDSKKHFAYRIDEHGEIRLLLDPLFASEYSSSEPEYPQTYKQEGEASLPLYLSGTLVCVI